MRMIDRRLAGLAGRHRLLFAATVGAGLGAGLATVGQALVLARILSSVFLAGATLGGSGVLLALLAGLALLRAALTALERILAHRLGARIGDAVFNEVLAHIERVGPIGLGRHHSGEIQSTLTEGMNELTTWFTDYLPQIALSALVPVTVLVVVVTRDLLSAVVLGLTAPLIPVFMVLIGSAADVRARSRLTARSRMAAFFSDTLQGLATLIMLDRIGDRIEAVRRTTDRLRRTTMEVLRLAFTSALVLELIATLSTAVVAVEIGLRLLSGRLLFQDALLVLLLAPEFYLPFRLLGQRFHAGTSGVAVADRIFGLLDTPVATSSPQECRGSMPAPQCIELTGIEVVYPARGGENPTPALDGVSLRLERGRTVALVGPSGSGKSTVVHVLLRLIEPSRGEIRADGVPADAIAADAWRRHIAWVPQRPHLMTAGLRDNIRMARAGATDAEVEAAARAVGLLDLVERLPQGWDTPIGYRGARLSGGEAQRLALARAFLKDAAVILLDEPGAGLDPESLVCIQRATAELLQGRIGLVIAHRLTTVRRADMIVVVEDGRIVEQGGFADLERAGGPFAETLLTMEGVG